MCEDVALCRATQTALKTLHVFHRLMRECDTHLLQLVRTPCPCPRATCPNLTWASRLAQRGSFLSAKSTSQMLLLTRLGHWSQARKTQSLSRACTLRTLCGHNIKQLLKLPGAGMGLLAGSGGQRCVMSQQICSMVCGACRVVCALASQLVNLLPSGVRGGERQALPWKP